LRAKAFVRRFAPIIKKNLLMEAMNLRIRGSQSYMHAITQQPSKEQQLFIIELEEQSNIGSFSKIEDISKQYISPDLPILYLGSNPILIDYF
jgi:hypothetical protein